MQLRLNVAAYVGSSLVAYAQVLLHTLHRMLYGSPGMAAIKGHVFVHSPLNLVLYLEAPPYLVLPMPIFCHFGEPRRSVSLSLSESLVSQRVAMLRVSCSRDDHVLTKILNT